MTPDDHVSSILVGLKGDGVARVRLRAVQALHSEFVRGMSAACEWIESRSGTKITPALCAEMIRWSCRMANRYAGAAAIRARASR